MKSERRHELQTNVLADWVGHKIDAVKPHVSLIVTIILAAAAVFAAWTWFLRWNTSSSSAAWGDYFRATEESEPAALIEMAKKHAGAPSSAWAMLLAADVQLAEGAGQAFSDRKKSESNLKQALESYTYVSKELREPVLARRALYGLAETHESLYAVTGDKKHLKEAIERYKQVKRQWPESMLGLAAGKKTTTLEKESSQDFLVWFSKQEPTPLDPTGGESAEPAKPSSPFDLTTLPGADELLLPDEAEATPPGEAPSSSPPAEAPAADTNPAEAPPSDASAAPTTPATETPATEPPAAESPATPPSEGKPQPETAPPAQP